MHQRRSDDRAAMLGLVTMSFADRGTTMLVHGTVINMSPNGLCIKIDRPLAVGSTVAVEGSAGSASGQVTINSAAEVRWCVAASPSVYRVGLKLTPAEERSSGWKNNSREQEAVNPDPDEDYYDVLQLSHTADAETINRVFRILASRYHPDNKETADEARFRKVVDAHEVLSNPSRRAAYDAAHAKSRRVRWKIFENAAVTRSAAAERRKRAALLSALYTQRVNDPNRPGMSLRELEQLLGCPSEHLEFTIWYLRQKQMVASADNGKLQITVTGIDAAEELSDIVPESKQLPQPASAA